MPIVDAYLTGNFEWWDLTKEDVQDLNLIGREVEGDSGTVTIARADRSHYRMGWSDETNVTEFGTCPHCDLEIASWAKHALCPACKSPARLT